MEYKIEKDYADVRLDKYVRKHFPDLALTEIFKGIRIGKIKVNGKKSKQNYRLCEGDIVKIFFDVEQKKDNFVKIDKNDIEYIKKYIVYEDENILIFNKEANMVMHKGSGHEYGISEIIKGYLGNSDFNFVNRIDKSTSGLVIGAKNLVTARELSEEIRDRNIDKKYYIIVDGKVEKKEFVIKSYLKKLDDKVVEREKFEPGAKESISKFKVIRYGKNCTLLEGALGSGRTHQLRVQLSSFGHPIMGDNKYGRGKGGIMYLFSYYLNIKKYNIAIELPLPIEYNKVLS